jgi:hypothetical protein
LRRSSTTTVTATLLLRWPQKQQLRTPVAAVTLAGTKLQLHLLMLHLLLLLLPPPLRLFR